MDRTIQQIIGALHARSAEQLRSLGDFPKAEPFDHGVQVGTYQGLQTALGVIEAVLNEEAELEARR